MGHLHEPVQDHRPQNTLVEEHDVHGNVRQPRTPQRVREGLQEHIKEIEGKRDPDDGDPHIDDRRIRVEDAKSLPPKVKQDAGKYQRVAHAENQRSAQPALHTVIQPCPHILSRESHHGLPQGAQGHVEQQLDAVVGGESRDSRDIEPIDKVLYEDIGKGYHYAL